MTSHGYDLPYACRLLMSHCNCRPPHNARIRVVNILWLYDSLRQGQVLPAGKNHQPLQTQSPVLPCPVSLYEVEHANIRG